MTTHAPDFLTTRELAELLRIKERKIYDLAAAGEVPCVRAVGKLLFPRAEIEAWIAASRSGPATARTPLPLIVAGSHCPLLDWALRESGSGLAAMFDGSFDGLERFARREALACAIHIHDGGEWNGAVVCERFGDRPIVQIEFARRMRGLIVAPGNPKSISAVGDLTDKIVARRQHTAASQRLLEQLFAETGLDPAKLAVATATARTESELALLVMDGKADVAFGLQAMAAQYRLGFVPLIEERFDLLVWRKAYFDAPMQGFMKFLQGAPFRNRAAEFAGYDISGLGAVRFNGAEA
jgi:excisionase family DNA binding protein